MGEDQQEQRPNNFTPEERRKLATLIEIILASKPGQESDAARKERGDG
jgi:hypothetical protein